MHILEPLIVIRAINRLSSLHAHMEELLDTLNISTADLPKIHGSAPGVFVKHEQPSKWSNHAVLEEQDMQAFLQQAFQTPVLLNHSSNFFLYGEKISDEVKDIDHVVYIDFGYGLGSGNRCNRRPDSTDRFLY